MYPSSELSLLAMKYDRRMPYHGHFPALIHLREHYKIRAVAIMAAMQQSILHHSHPQQVVILLRTPSQIRSRSNGLERAFVHIPVRKFHSRETCGLNGGQALASQKVTATVAPFRA